MFSPQLSQPHIGAGMLSVLCNDDEGSNGKSELDWNPEKQMLVRYCISIV